MTKGQPLGQHWLKDGRFLESIVESANLNATDTVLEIGPGQGDLTYKLTRIAKQVVAVELDSKLIETFSRGDQPKNLKIVASDIRDFDLSQMPDGYKVVANIPYYLTGEIIRLLLTDANKPQLVVLLVQKEVAQQAAASAGKMSVLSITSQFLAEVSLGEIVPAAAFQPPPKVDSQVLILKPLTKLRIEVDPEKFIKLVKMAFAMKRKKLANSLAHLEGGQKALDELNLADSRPQELTFEQWQSLYNKLYA